MYQQVSEILCMAEQSNTAVISFICQDYIMARSVVYAAEKTNTPALVMLFPEHVTIQKTTGIAGYAAMVKELAGEVKVPIGLHLDHSYSLEALMKAMNGGFESVMIDGSAFDLKKNIEITREVVDTAHRRNVFVEGEIGHVGVAKDADNEKEDLYTKADAAELFCRESGADMLAVSIGNAHGEYRDLPKLDIERLREIHAAVSVPLVLHGGSGIPDDQLLLAFQNGVRKFNLGTDYLKLYYQAVLSFSEENRDNPDPVKIIHMAEYVQEKLQPYVEERLKTLCKF